jgi:hypothetical protein
MRKPGVRVRPAVFREWLCSAPVLVECADLGYRLFLRAVKAYLVPVPEDTELYDTVVALAERFGYPEELVRDGLVDLAD